MILLLALLLDLASPMGLPRSLGEPCPLGQEAAGPDLAELAKKLANPVASLVSVPVQVNWDNGAGRDDSEYGRKWLVNVQPVIPVSLSEDWNLISRTIVPFISQEEIFAFDRRQSGLGDVLQSFFFSPAQPGPGGLIWGAGPVALVPTATDELLGAEKWGFGPTAVALVQDGPWTYGALVNHLWASEGDDHRANVNATYLQPFIVFAPAKGMTVALNTEATFDWRSDDWTLPINLAVNQVVPIGGRLFQFGLGVRWYAEAPETAADWGLRFSATLLLPK